MLRLLFEKVFGFAFLIGDKKESVKVFIYPNEWALTGP